jgi:ubiquitin-conjugating enzyme E2 variant
LNEVVTRLFWLLSIVSACAACATAAARVSVDVGWSWWTMPVLALGVAAADLASGLAHWAADTWGREDLPLIGRRLLVPFRLHHVDPDDFLQRQFVDTNGDVAFLAMPVLVSVAVLPVHEAWMAGVAVFGLGFAGVGMWTNQIHQWAHMADPPRPVRLLQDARVLLGRRSHARHHQGTYDSHYCITTGWWNAPLERTGFFRRLETVVTRLTGARPRDDEQRSACSRYPIAP